eukprot:1759618-Prymnesium_polylepis.1
MAAKAGRMPAGAVRLLAQGLLAAVRLGRVPPVVDFRRFAQRRRDAPVAAERLGSCPGTGMLERDVDRVAVERARHGGDVVQGGGQGV